MIAPDEYNQDPIEELQDAEPGTVIYGFAGGEQPHMEFLIREHSERIKLIDQEVQVRAGLLTERGIPVPVVLFQFPPNESVYRTFWNYHHPDVSPEDGNIFDYMATGSDEILIKFIGDTARVEKMLVLRHPLAGFFQRASEQARATVPWTIDQFFDALDKIAERNTSAGELWEAFAGK